MRLFEIKSFDKQSFHWKCEYMRT